MAADRVHRPPQDGAGRDGSQRNADALGHASGRRRRTCATAAVSGSARRATDASLALAAAPARYQELRSKPVLTAVGRVEVSRPYYLCAHCHNGQFPADVELDIENTEFSPGVRRMQAMVGQEAPFDQGRQQMKVLAGLGSDHQIGGAYGGGDWRRYRRRASSSEIQQAVQLDLPVIMGEPIPILYVQMDGTGVPVVKKETEGRKGKTDGQPAHTREVKLGCVFTQTTWDKEGYAIRDPDSTTYTGAIETAEEFGKRIYLEAWNRGWSRARKESRHGRWGRMDLESGRSAFPRRRSDRRSLSRAPASLGSGAQAASQRRGESESLDEDFTRSACSTRGKSKSWWLRCAPSNRPIPKFMEKIRIEADYFERNAERMRYPKFRRQHLFVGSGVIEAGCKTVIGSRLKQSGMFWTVRGANAIIALRCCHLNGRFEDYWEGRRAA